MLSGVILHLQNDLPVLVDMDELPGPGDWLVRCTNVRTVDGKRPAFVHDRNATFLFPIGVIRLIEAPSEGSAERTAAEDGGTVDATPPEPAAIADEEPDEDFLARIRDI